MASPAELQGSARAVGLPASGGSANAQALGTQDAAVFASLELSPDGGSGMIESDDDKGMTIIDGWNQPIVNLNTDNYGVDVLTNVYVNGTLVVDSGGSLYYSDGHYLTDSGGNLYYGNGYQLADGDGNLYYTNNNPLVDNSGALYYNNGTPLADHNGNLYYSTGYQLTDAGGNLYYGTGNVFADGDGNLRCNNNGNVLADGDGNLTSPSLTVNALGGNSVFLGAFTTADLPSASGNRYAYLICTNGGTGSTPVPQWSDGTSWRKFTIV